jgi:predicted enzyme related to lactoylglutathione lyase
MSSVRLAGLWGMNPVVHLELHTGHLARACALYEELLGWRAEQTRGYWSFGTGCGVVECGSSAPAWLPYVAVRDVAVTTERARALGAAVLLDPREGPHGWRSVVSTPEGGELALWQPKR